MGESSNKLAISDARRAVLFIGARMAKKQKLKLNSNPQRILASFIHQKNPRATENLVKKNMTRCEKAR